MSLRLRTLPAGFIVPCLFTSAKRPPAGDGWLHEMKHEGCRVIARKNGDRVWLYNCPGNGLRALTCMGKAVRLGRMGSPTDVMLSSVTTNPAFVTPPVPPSL
jgi:hypothetical protein